MSQAVHQIESSGLVYRFLICELCTKPINDPKIDIH